MRNSKSEKCASLSQTQLIPILNVKVFNSYLFLTGVSFDKEFNAALTGIQKNIKAAGKGDTAHFQPLPLEVQNAIHKLLGNLQTLVRHRKNGDPVSYETALKKLPHEYKHTYHLLIVNGAQYTVTKFDARRGQEGIELLTKSHYEIVEENDFKFYKKVKIILF